VIEERDALEPFEAARAWVESVERMAEAGDE